MDTNTLENTSSWTDTSVDGSAVDALALGDAAFVNERYDDALTNYTVATLRHHTDAASLLGPTRFRIHAHRAAAHAALANHEDCINDTEIALALLPIGGLKLGEVELCWRRQGLAHFAMQDIEKAKAAFKKAKQLADLEHNTSMAASTIPTKTTFDYPAWISRCNQLLKTTGSVVGSSRHLPSINPIPEARQGPSLNRPIDKPRYQYYQNDTTMTIAILEPNVQESDLSVESDNASIRIHLVKQGKEFSVLGGALQETITGHRIQIRNDKVLVKLRKEKPGEWHELMDAKKVSTLPPRAAISSSTTPDGHEQATTVPRPYASRKDWKSIEQEIQQQEEKETPQGDDAMNKLFQRIYANADEDTRRAMIKSYQTSGGTVLSTNWREVASKDYEKERTAPKGMEWKNWEGEKLPMDDKDDE